MAVSERVFERHRIGLQQAIVHTAVELPRSPWELLLRSQLHAAANWFTSRCSDPFFEHGT